MEYKEAIKAEYIGKDHIGIQIMLSIGRELTAREDRACSDAVEILSNAIHSENVRLDPATAVKVQEDRESLLACFPSKLYVEELPNGYGPMHPYWQHFPWYQVTTEKGRIKIGWRKRVISIEWEEATNYEYAIALFPTEDVTKDKRTIHAWSYEKAKEYVAAILTRA